MEINANSPVNGLESAAKIGEVKRDKADTPDQPAVEEKESPDYRLSLSKNASPATSEAAAATPAKIPESVDLNAAEAAELSQSVASQLAQTQSSIANQGIQRAIDLFT